MFLKSLSLYGFKTFANKLDFEFKPGVTAIVGPNGSGKSNLIDAIIWVMGEQSVRSIRGRKMAEVIFHGSTKKKPLGYAQVVITFDNEDGFFPLPHSEISIMRRYYKSGESEFAINREPCRLRDIHSLVLDTGLGKMNYSVINQGDVEYIIDLSPLQRREIFDEAAGINRYKVEKAKTFQKIKETDQNIARLRDILTEIEEQLEPLRVQAEKAQRYEELTEQIEKLKLSVMVSDITRLVQRLEELGQEEQQLKESGREAQVEISKMGARLAELAEAYDSRRSEIDEKMEELTTLGSEVGRTEESIRRLSNSLDQTRTNISSMEQRKKEASNRIETLSAAITESGKQLQEKSGELNKAREQLGGMDQPGGGALEREQQLASECADTRAGIQELITEQTRLKNEIDLHRRQINEIEAASSRQTEEKTGIQKNIDELKNKLASLDGSIAEKKAELDRLVPEEKKLDDELPSLTRKIEADREEFNTLTDKIRELRARKSALENVAQTVESLYRKAAADAGTEGLADLASGAGFADNSYNAARRALGNALRAGITSSDRISKKAAAGDENAAIYLLADWLDNGGIPDLSHLKQEDGVAGLLSDFISTENIHSPGPGLERALRGVVVMESADALMSMIDRIPAGAGAVTRDGETVFRDGVLCIGEEPVTPEAVTERLKGIEAELAEKEAEAEGMGERLEETEKKFAEQSRRHGEIHGSIMKLEAALQASGDRRETFAERLSFYESELASVESSISSAGPRHEELVSGLEKFESSLSETEKKIQKQQAVLDEKQPELDELVSLRKSLMDKRAEMAAEIERLQQETEELRNGITAKNTERSQLEERIEEGDQALEGLWAHAGRVESDLETAREELENWRKKQKKVQEELETTRTALADIAEERKVLNGDIERLRNEMAEGKETLGQLEVKKARAETQLDEVRRQFMEEFPGMTEERAIEEAPPVQTGEKGLFKSLRAEREALMPVNQLAIGEFEEKKSRHDGLLDQISDLEDTRATLMDIVDKYDDKSRVEFLETFNAVQEKFSETFIEIFQGGEARLVLTDEEDPLEAGVEIKVQVPGQRMRNIVLLSGGQKAMCALTLIFAILKVKPSPFYLLDEVDAGLDEVNVGRFKDMLHKYSTDGQFIVVTHNKGTISGADHFYGITLDQEEGYSKVISVSLE